MAHEILLQNSHKPISVVANVARQPTSPACPSNQSFQKNNSYRNNDASSTGNKKWFPNSCQICGLNNHQAKWCRKCYNRDNITVNASNVIASSNDWFPDTVVSHHMTPDLSALEISEEYKEPDTVSIGNGHGLHIKNIGHSTLSSSNNQFHLKNVLHVSALQQQLLSVNKFAKDNHCSFKFDSVGFTMKHQTNKQVLLKGPAADGVYNLPIAAFKNLIG
ncbi:hypothetical protein P3L10_022857 [Capsicum annuum]